MVAFADVGFVLRQLDGPPYRVAEALRLRDIAGVLDVVAGMDEVVVLTESPDFDPNLLRTFGAVGDFEAKLHSIPVCYELGADLDSVAELLRLETDELVRLHAGNEYTCAMVGFQPGFAYLQGLPKEISGVPRLPNPRVRVEAGSVGLTGDQTAVYPSALPGGWMIIGRTPLTVADRETRRYPIRAGDKVRFLPISIVEFDQLVGTPL